MRAHSVGAGILGGVVCLMLTGAGCGVTTTSDDTTANEPTVGSATPADATTEPTPEATPEATPTPTLDAQGDGGAQGDPSMPEPELTYEFVSGLIDPEASQHIPCDGEDLSITTHQVAIVLRGECGRVTVDGSQASILADSIEWLTVNGSQNVVAAHHIGGGEVTGAQNEVYWTGDDPVIEDMGVQNSILRIKERA